MKKILPALLSGLVIFGTQSTLLAHDAIETFDYPEETPLGEIGDADAEGWIGSWQPSGGESDFPDNLIIGADSLDSAAFESRGLQPKGNKLTVRGLATNVGIQRELAQPIDFRTDSTIYISFLAEWAQSHPNMAARFRFQNPDGTTFAGLSGDGITPNTMVLRTRINGQDTNQSMESFPARETHFLVIKIETVASGLDTISAIAFSPGDEVGEEPMDWMATSSFGSNEILTHPGFNIMLYGAVSPDREAALDEIRIGPTWDAVTSPE